MSCDKVRKHILERKNSNVIGIIDGDFDDKFENDNLFKIDFYSIENIALIHHPSLLELRDSSLDYLKNNFDKFKKLLITFNGNEFNIKIGDRIPKKFHSYLRKKIKNKNNYIRYMNLKDFVLAFCNKKCPNFKKDLYDCIEFENLFSKNEFERFNKTIEAILRL